MANVRPTVARECTDCYAFLPLGQTPCHPYARSGLVALCSCGFPMVPDGRAGGGKFLLLVCRVCGNRGKLKR